MKVIFLDIDGVLNSEEYYRYRQKVNLTTPYPISEFDPAAVVILNDIIKLTGAKLVISSSWRADKNVENVLRKAGIEGEIVGSTPFIMDQRARGREIQMYLDLHPEVENYVILDDDNDMLESQQKHFVQTDAFTDGLNYKLEEKCIEILGKLELDLLQGLQSGNCINKRVEVE